MYTDKREGTKVDTGSVVDTQIIDMTKGKANYHIKTSLSKKDRLLLSLLFVPWAWELQLTRLFLPLAAI
jgi:hypothetical protein